MLDVTDAGQIAAVAERIAAETGEAGLDGLVNNAGIAVPGPLEALPIDDFRRQVEVNLTAQVAVTQALLSSIRRASGRIVFITSVGGRMAFPMFGAYHAAKFGLEAVGDVFRQELRPWGIEVAVIEPGSNADLGAGTAGGRGLRRPRQRRAGAALRPVDRRLSRGRAADRRPRHSARAGREGGRARALRAPSPHPLPGRPRREGAGPAKGDPAGPAGRPPRRPHDWDVVAGGPFLGCIVVASTPRPTFPVLEDGKSRLRANPS